jgi:transposase
MSRNLFWLSDEQWTRIEPHLPTDGAASSEQMTGA